VYKGTGAKNAMMKAMFVRVDFGKTRKPIKICKKCDKG
jgi:hypothetical protein